jgi:hypothetical protein
MRLIEACSCFAYGGKTLRRQRPAAWLHQRPFPFNVFADKTEKHRRLLLRSLSKRPPTKPLILPALPGVETSHYPGPAAYGLPMSWSRSAQSRRLKRAAAAARPLTPFRGQIRHLIVCSPAGAIPWKCCARKFSRCAAAHKMRLAVKSPCILAAARCALSAFRERAEQHRSRSMRRSLRATEHRRNANGRSSC